MSVEIIIQTIAEKARTDAHAESFIDSSGKLCYKPVDKPITPELIARHLAQGPYLGVYFLSPGSSKCSLAAIDLDDKTGTAGTDKMRAVAIGLHRALSAAGFSPFLERSGSGTGLHIWLIFAEPQEAGRIRAMLLEQIRKCGLKEGTGGVASGEVELFPRQASLPANSYGNLIALPYNRKSSLLTPTFDEVPENVLHHIRKKVSRNIIEADCGAPPEEEKKTRKKGRKEKDKETPPTLAEVEQCLRLIPNDDLEYDEWLEMLYAVHHATDGSDDGYNAFLEWSMKSDKHDEAQCNKVWTHCADRGDDGVTWRTLVHKAKEHGWVRFLDLFDELVYVADQDMFYSLKNSTTYNEGSLKRTYAHLHDDMANYMLTNPSLRKVDGITYWPGQDVIVPEGNARKLNRWRDPKIEAKPGDVEIFLEHMRNLIPDEMERNHVLDFLSFIVQNPGEKVRHSIVIQGEQGIGKSYVAYMMGYVIGKENVRAISNQALKADFNGWMANVSLLTIEEIMVKGRLEIMNNLKTSITQDEIQINEKHEKPYYLPNRVNFIMFTNHKDALILEQGDRRYFVYFSPMDPSEFAEDYFDKLFEWTAANGPALKYYFLSRDLANFDANARPPMTDAKREILQTSKPNEQLVLERMLAAKVKPPLLQNDIVDISAVIKTVRNEGEVMDEKQIERALRSMGCKRIEGSIWIVRNVEEWMGQEYDAQMKEYHGKKPIPGGKARDMPPPAKEAF